MGQLTSDSRDAWEGHWWSGLHKLNLCLGTSCEPQNVASNRAYILCFYYKCIIISGQMCLTVVVLTRCAWICTLWRSADEFIERRVETTKLSLMRRMQNNSRIIFLCVVFKERLHDIHESGRDSHELISLLFISVQSKSQDQQHMQRFWKS